MSLHAVPVRRRFVSSEVAAYVIPAEELPSKGEEKRRFLVRMGLMLKGVIDGPDYSPPLLPDVAVELTRIANLPNVDIGDVEATVQRDPVVAARVLSIANSAAFGRVAPIKSLRGAIMRLGLAEVRDVAFRVVAQTRIFRIPAYAAHMRQLLEAAQAGGIAAREVCRTLRFESDLAFLGGLFRDMGAALILGIVGEQHRGKTEQPPTLQDMAPVLERYHAAMGARVCRSWKLQEALTDAIMYHHDPERSSHLAQLALVVRVADLLLRHAGIGCEARRLEPLAEPIFYRLNLAPEQVSYLLEFSERLGEDRESWAAD
jgi:HD-like signal output (HDOD) protein